MAKTRHSLFKETVNGAGAGHRNYTSTEPWALRWFKMYDHELEVALTATRRVGELALGYWRKGIEAEAKKDESPVTAADRHCERLFVQELMANFPSDGVLGEEGAGKAPESGRRWIIDPIDGTRDFVRGNRFWAQLLGLEVDGEVVLGIAHLPAL